MTGKRLAPHVQVPPLDDAALARSWARVQTIRDQRPVRTFGAWLFSWKLLGAVGAACALALLVARSRAPATEAGSFEVSADARDVRLEDGSRVELAPSTALKSCEAARFDTCLLVEQGSAKFRVTKNPSRSFRVQLGDVQVRVVGTVFSVTRQASERRDEVSVEVEEGVVEVVTAGVAARRLVAGERWSNVVDHGPLEPAPAPLKVEVSDPPTDGTQGQPTEPPARVADEGDARRLLERAREARRQRRPRDAERSYEQVLADFPQSRFASLAAFELGRLRMDALDDLAGAVRALERSLRSPGQDHREDALGRLVQLTRELGRKSECEVWRARYLKQFPEGAHLTSMERGCER